MTNMDMCRFFSYLLLLCIINIKYKFVLATNIKGKQIAQITEGATCGTIIPLNGKCYCGKYLTENKIDTENWEENEWKDENGQLFIKAEATLICGQQEESQIYHAYVLDFPMHINYLYKCVAIKVLTYRKFGFHKTRKMLGHELDILIKSMKEQAKYVVKLIDYLKLPNFLILVLELGTESLNHRLKQLKAEWKLENTDLAKINFEVENMLAQMTIALNDLHRFAVHLALKSENWVFMNKNGVEHLTLIDLQTSVEVENGKIDIGTKRKRKELRAYMCKTTKGRSHLPRTRRFASPEHRKFCETKGRHEVTIQTDIWSLAIVLLEILAYTPQIDAICRLYQNGRFYENGKRNYKIFRNAFVDHEFPVKSGEEDDTEFDEKAKIVISQNFPKIYQLIKRMLAANPNVRPTTHEIMDILEIRNKMI